MAIMPLEHPPGTPAARFFAKVSEDAATGCWEWTGARIRGGYGKFFLRKEPRPDGGRKTILTPAHRWAYEHLVGAIPDGLEIDHLCRNRGCVNPWHLEPVTHAENGWRKPRGGVCGNGHPFTPDNTGWRIRNKHGIPRRQRWCRTCARAANRRAYWRGKECI